jgi:hypothetical protein
MAFYCTKVHQRRDDVTKFAVSVDFNFKSRREDFNFKSQPFLN